jgi:O-antigen ligase/polysaccharide polymerase Wzy-like membrane protein
MPHSLKDLIVVLVLALVVFRLARPIAMHFTTDADFARRRNVWLVLTIAAFLSPSFWLFTALAIPVLVWAGRKDPNPVAAYLMLFHVIPSLPLAIPVVGINELFDLDSYRLLSFCILIPAALQLRRTRDATRIAGLQSMDVLLLAFGLLQIALYIPPDLPNHVILPDSLTNVLRRGLLFFVDVYVLYFVISRSCANRRRLVDAMAAFCLGCAVMAAVAAFESLRHWLLYADLQVSWTANSTRSYLERAGVLRAQASAGHSLALGYLLAVAFGFWLYLQTLVDSKRSRLGVTLLFWLGLVAAYSRGPWVGALAIYLAFMAVGPGGFARTFKAAAVIGITFGALSLTPLGDRIVNVLPFLGGSVDKANVAYRQKLATRSWELIQEHPLLGDQLAYFKMNDLRQGEGIIDLVNTYADIALFYGLIGLFFFVGFALLGLVRAYRTVGEMAVIDPDLARLGTSLVACILGTLLMIFDSSFILGYEKMFYVLVGLAAAYAQLRPAPAASPALPA